MIIKKGTLVTKRHATYCNSFEPVDFVSSSSRQRLWSSTSSRPVSQQSAWLLFFSSNVIDASENPQDGEEEHNGEFKAYLSMR